VYLLQFMLHFLLLQPLGHELLVTNLPDLQPHISRTILRTRTQLQRFLRQNRIFVVVLCVANQFYAFSWQTHNWPSAFDSRFPSPYFANARIVTQHISPLLESANTCGCVAGDFAPASRTRNSDFANFYNFPAFVIYQLVRHQNYLFVISVHSDCAPVTTGTAAFSEQFRR
jgi:hypothetical protein